MSFITAGKMNTVVLIYFFPANFVSHVFELLWLQCCCSFCIHSVGDRTGLTCSTMYLSGEIKQK